MRNGIAEIRANRLINLSRAVIALKQGAGRLIRDEADRGALVICDPRLVDKPYGKRIWRALPAFRRTRKVADVEAFFAATASPSPRKGPEEGGVTVSSTEAR